MIYNIWQYLYAVRAQVLLGGLQHTAELVLQQALLVQHLCIYIYVCVWVCVCVCGCVCVCVCVCVEVSITYLCICKCVYESMYSVYLCTCVYVYVCMYVCMCVCMYIGKYIYLLPLVGIGAHCPTPGARNISPRSPWGCTCPSLLPRCLARPHTASCPAACGF
jgi:hypothetical protein